jgi:RNA polymerase sigma factor for flagellar operon FliA
LNAATVYAEQQETLRQNERIVQNLPLVKKIALHLLARLPSSVELDDLQQAGLFGLLSASRSYSADHGASFETYAGIRIKGAMLDELRKLSWAPRSVHEKARRLSESISIVEARVGRSASDQEIAAELGVDLDEYHQMLLETSASNLFSLDDLGLDTQTQEEDPEIIFRESRFKESLQQSIEDLPEKERTVMALYYQEDLNLKEIGLVLSVSESRVSQIHSQALTRIRAKMSQWLS